MQDFVIAAAQLTSRVDDLNANIVSHIKLIEKAATLGVRVLIFPELSLTGYTRKLTKDNIFTEDDQRFNTFKTLARKLNMVLALGAPYNNRENGIHIALFLVFPDGKIAVHCKRFLHQGEEVCFAPGNKFHPIQIDGVTIHWAICADINYPEIAKEAELNRCDVFATSVFITPDGYANDIRILKNYAVKHKMMVVMANFGEGNEEYEAAGKSAIWDKNGQILDVLDGKEGGLVLSKWNKR